jgi:hypothetical protein
MTEKKAVLLNTVKYFFLRFFAESLRRDTPCGDIPLSAQNDAVLFWMVRMIYHYFG